MRVDQPRLGIPTASNFHLICTNEGKPGNSREKAHYKHKLVYERLTGERVKETFHNEHTEHGLNSEVPAAKALCAFLGVELLDGCFCTTNDKRFGCTPDRFVKGKSEVVEIKAVAGWNHVEYMLEGPGNKYRPQVQGQLWITGYRYAHFWAWHPKLEPVYLRVERDDEYIKKLRMLLALFHEDIVRAESKIRRAGNINDLKLVLEAGEAYLQ